jgi:large subunit ribosomal protein L10
LNFFSKFLEFLCLLISKKFYLSFKKIILKEGNKILMLRNVIEYKKKNVDKLVNDINDSKIVILLEFKGLTVQNITELRVKLRKKRSYIKSYPNNIIKRAFDKLNLKEFIQFIKYPKALLLSVDNNHEVIKILFNFIKNIENNKKILKVLIGSIENKIYSQEMINVLSVLPSKKDLLSILILSIITPIKELAIILEILSKKEKL